MFNRQVASPTKDATENTVRASQIKSTVNVAETPGAAPVVKEAAGNILEASHEPEELNKGSFRKLLRKIVDPEQLDEIFEVGKGAQTDLELK